MPPPTTPSPPLPMVREKYPRSKYLDADDAGEPKTARCARKRQTRCLPQEMVFDILLHLPAQVLHDVIRHVCIEWNLMIRSRYFIHHHLRNSTSGIIIQQLFSVRNAIYVEMRRGCLEICKFDCGFEHLVRSSCNGLALVPDLKDLYILYVINPLTKQRAVLPPFFRAISLHSEFKLAFVEASMEYKVVNACGPKPRNPPKQIAVLTIGVDRVWRHIDVKHLPLTTRRALTSSPLVTGGYIHWIGKTFVLTLKVETETFCEFSMPQLQKSCGKFLSMGSNLSVVYGSSKFLRDVWEMNSETGEWTMLLSFDLKPLHYRFKGLFSKYEKSIIAFGWLAAREVLLLSTSGVQRRCIAYNVKTGEIHGGVWLDTNAKPYNFEAHVNSLVFFEGGF